MRSDWLEKAMQARKHTDEMKERYGKEIVSCAYATRVYDSDFQPTNKRDKNAVVQLTAEDTVSAVFRECTANPNKKVAALNFASYTSPGGLFLEGSPAQEEALCHESILYNVLSQKESYYKFNNRTKNKGLYLDRALYSPDVLFVRGSATCKCDVITCAAPNWSVGQRYRLTTDHENRDVLRLRQWFVYDVAEDNKVDILILGAFGCGVFKQNPTFVASNFMNILTTTQFGFEKVLFAIPDVSSKNHKAFLNVITDDVYK